MTAIPTNVRTLRELHETLGSLKKELIDGPRVRPIMEHQRLLWVLRDTAEALEIGAGKYTEANTLTPINLDLFQMGRRRLTQTEGVLARAGAQCGRLAQRLTEVVANAHAAAAVPSGSVLLSCGHDARDLAEDFTALPKSNPARHLLEKALADVNFRLSGITAVARESVDRSFGAACESAPGVSRADRAVTLARHIDESLEGAVTLFRSAGRQFGKAVVH
jgi:hypothetical protein